MKSWQKLTRILCENHPEEAAQALEALPIEEANRVLANLDHRGAVRVVEQMNSAFAARFLQQGAREIAAKVLCDLPLRPAAAIFQQLSEEARAEVMELLKEPSRQHLQLVTSYSADSVGALMTPQVSTLRAGHQVQEAIRMLRQLRPETVFYLYVTDDARKLVGVANLRDLILANPHQKIEELMNRELVTLKPEEDRERVAGVMRKTGFHALPVVGREGELLGVVRQGDVLTVVEQEASEDMQKMVGAGGDEHAFSPVWYSLRKRMPWLQLNLATAFLAAAVVWLFESSIGKVTALAVLLPIVAGQGGNTGAQSLAVVIRGLALGQVVRGQAFRLFFREAILGLSNGLVISVTTGAVVWLWSRDWMLSLAISAAMVLTMVVAGAAGAAIPIALRALGRDPAQGSSILLTTATDVVGFLSFLGLSTLFVL